MYYMSFTFKNMKQAQKTEPSFLSLNHCLVPALTLLACCPLRKRIGLKALYGGKQHT